MKTILPKALALLGLCLPLIANGEECVLSINQPLVDYGQSQRAQLLEGTREGNRLLVGTRVITLNFSCASNTTMALSFNGEAAGEQGYSFARGGMFTLRVLSAQVDGKSVRLMVRDAGGTAQGTDNQLRPGVSLVPMDLSQAVRGNKLSAQVEVKTYVDERDTQARSQEQWEGGGQFSVETF